MPSKNTSVISARVKDETAIKLGEIAENRGISIPKLIDEIVEKYEAEEGVTPDGYGLFEEFDTPLGQKLEKQFDRLRERGYPEKYIGQMKDNLVESIRSQIEMFPKKYDPRRMRDNDCGC